MHLLRRFLVVEAVESPGRSALAYVPIVMVSRAMAFLRTLLVGRILGDAGQIQFGLYQPSLDLINILVALVMFGLADIAERYVSTIERNEGPASVRRWLGRHIFRLLLSGAILAVIMIAGAQWLALAVWGKPAPGLLAACALTVILLAAYQYLAAVLRGLRAYTAAAGMELLGAALLLILSAIAAWIGSAAALVLAYAASIFVPLIIYFFALRSHLQKTITPTTATDSPPARPHMTRFAAWSLVRLLLVMSLGFVTLWGVRVIAERFPTEGNLPTPALHTTGQFSMPFRIAQLLAFVAVTLWASSYGIAARAVSHGQSRRAWAQLFRIGKFGAALMTFAAVFLVWGRGIFELLLPTYALSIDVLLPGLLGLFIWYGLLAFANTTADLKEHPERAAIAWAVAVAVQLLGIAAAHFSWWTSALGAPTHASDVGPYMLRITAIGLGLGLFLVAPVLLCRPWRMTQTGMPLVILSLAAGSLFSPEWIVDFVAPPILLAALIFLWFSGLLFRPIDRRAWRRFRNAAKPSPS